MTDLHLHFHQPAAWLSFTGPDAGRFLQAQASADLRPFTRGRSVPALWLSRTGQVLADGQVLVADPETLIVSSRECPSDALGRKFEAHLIADQVEWEDLTPAWANLEAWGPAASSWCASLAGAVCPVGHALPVEDGWVWPSASIAHGFCLSFPRARASHWEEKAREAAGSAFALASRDDFEWARITCGRPAVPRDIGPQDLPQMAGQAFCERYLSLTKGCYLGQEVMAKVSRSDGFRQALCRLEGGGPAPAPGQTVTVGGEVAGTIRTAVGRGDRWVALAMLKRRSGAGAGVAVGGRMAEGSELL